MVLFKKKLPQNMWYRIILLIEIKYMFDFHLLLQVHLQKESISHLSA